MQKTTFIFSGTLALLAGASAFVSPFLSLGLAAASAALSFPAAFAWKRAKSKTEHLMLLEDERTAKVLCDRRGYILAFNVKGGEFFGSENIFLSLADKVFSGDKTSQDNFLKLLPSLSAGLDISVPLLAGAKGDEYYEVSLRHIKGRSFYLATAADLTSQHFTSAELKSSLDLAHSTLDLAPIGILRTDKGGIISFASHTLCTWLGTDSLSIEGQNFYDFITTKDEIATLSLASLNGVYELAPANSAPFPAFITSAPAPAPDDGFCLAILKDALATNANATTATAPETTAQHLRQRLSWLFKDTPFGIALTGKDGIISEVNPALCTMLDKPARQLLGTPVFSALGASSCFDLQDKISKVLSGELSGAKTEVKTSLDASDQAKVFAVFTRPMKEKSATDGETISGLIFHFFDTTEWKNLELQYEQAQKMSAMGQMASGIAHDFNNILTGILGFCDFLLARHQAGDPSYLDIKQIEAGSIRATNLVRELLAFSRKQPLAYRISDTAKVLDNTVDMVRQLTGSGIEFKVDYDRDLGYIKIDEGQFGQVFINLAVNARYAMQDKGLISIVAKNHEERESRITETENIPAGRYICFEFSDTGCGIPKENLKRIFEPFFSTKSAKGEGTGLGLATVYGIVRQSDGFISVTSTVAKGTTFTILLPRYEKPLSEEDESATKPTPEAKEKGQTVLLSTHTLPEGEGTITPPKSGRILVVDDESAVRLFASRALKNRGFEVTSAASGEEALAALAKDNRFDLLLTDMTMPNMDGITLAKKVQTLIPDIKVIIMSGFSEDIAKGAISEGSTLNFLGKPFNLDTVVSKVREVLG